MNSKIIVCTLRIGEQYQQVTKYASVNKKLYCEKHGYTFTERLESLDSSKTPHWSKLILMLSLIEQYDYVVWMDSDLYIMNPDMTLESFITRLMGDKDIMVGSDWKMSNTGVIFAKNTKWTIDFLKAWMTYSDPVPDKGNFEQDTFQELCVKNVMQSSNHVIVTAPQEFNCYWYNYWPGHFIFHMAGCKGEGLKIMMNKYCPVRMDDDTDESYSKRIKWLEHEVRDYLESEYNRTCK
jgi:hypothetical protein